MTTHYTFLNPDGETSARWVFAHYRPDTGDIIFSVLRNFEVTRRSRDTDPAIVSATEIIGTGSYNLEWQENLGEKFTRFGIGPYTH